MNCVAQLVIRLDDSRVENVMTSHLNIWFLMNKSKILLKQENRQYLESYRSNIIWNLTNCLAFNKSMESTLVLGNCSLFETWVKPRVALKAPL